ncbi:MAG: hypothetical protein ACRC7V_05980 [Lachnospiraceae bacterium]
MSSLLELKEYIKNFCGKYEIYLISILKFIIAIIVLTTINSNLGYMTRIDKITIVLIISLICAFMPFNFMGVISAVVVLLHLYELSLEIAVIGVAVFFLVFIFCCRTVPKDILVVLLMPILFLIGIPYLMPLVLGLMLSPLSIVSMIAGVMIYFFLNTVISSTTILTSVESLEATEKIKLVLDGIINNNTLYIIVVAFSITLLLVYFIRRSSIMYSWPIAIAIGTTIDVVILLIGEFVFDINISMMSLVLGGAISGAIGIIISFAMQNLDYKRTENVQFEDDEYYYYVKAIPKITVSTKKNSVKRIQPQKKVVRNNSSNQNISNRTIKTSNGIKKEFVATKNKE